MRKTTIAIFASILCGCSSTNKTATKALIKLNDLETQIKTYGFVPFKLPRTGDGVCTIITFEKKNEAVVASKSECLSNVLVDTVQNVVADYSYTLTNNDSVGLDLGKIFGDKVNLSGGYKNNRVKKITVKLISPFEARFTRIGVERQVEEIKKNDALCTKNLYSKKNYLIERVFGVKGISITLQDSSQKNIPFDLSILKEITSDVNIQRNFQGKSEINSTLQVLLGYRLWQFEGNPGFGETSGQIKPIDIDATLKTRENSN